MTFLYLMAKRTNDGCKPPIKVGISKDPKKRLAGLQTACPFDLHIFRVWKMECRDQAAFLENMFHEIQSADLLRGEWFNIEPEAGVELIELNFMTALVAGGMAPADVMRRGPFGRDWEQSK